MKAKRKKFEKISFDLYLSRYFFLNKLCLRILQQKTIKCRSFLRIIEKNAFLFKKKEKKI